MVFQERTYSVLLVSAGEKFSKTLTELLPPTHFWPVNLARSTDEARRALLSTQYDMVLINAPLPDDFGVQLAIDVCSRSDAGALLLVRNELFEGSKHLLLLADKIEEIKTICQYCSRKATMVLRTQAGKPVYDGEQIQIGGHETYISVCRKHYFNPDIKQEKKS